MSSTSILESLLKQEIEWENSQGLEPEDVWLRDGIDLYRDLAEAQPSETRFKVSLGRLLLQLGRSRKERSMNYREAKKIFEELLSIEPDSIYGNYHLGFLRFLQHDWNGALSYFLRIKNPNKLLPLQTIKLLCCSAICYKKTGDKEAANKRLAEAMKNNTDHTYTTELAFIEAMMENEEHPYILMIDQQPPIQITKEQADEISLNWQQGYLVLDFQPSRSEIGREKYLFTGPRDSVLLQPKEAEFLRYLVTHKRRNSSQILRDIWPNAASDDVIRRYVVRLRKSLQRCFSESMDEIIISRYGQGYEWSYRMPCKVICNNQLSGI